MKIKTRKEAKALNLPRYYTGVLCKNGHKSERYTKGAGCVQCVKQRRVDWNIKYPNYNKDWDTNHKPERAIASKRSYAKRDKDVNRERAKKSSNEYFLINSKFLTEYMQNKCCVKCGNTDQRVLEFDHIKKKQKYRSVKAMLHRVSLKTLIEEISKCQILCGNCHRRKTMTDQNSWKLHPGIRPKLSTNAYYRNQLFLWKYLIDNPCEVCGEDDIVVLEHDHIDPKTKTVCICEIRRGSIEKLKMELKKCRVLCRNCHLIHTRNQKQTSIDIG